jgi:hypothetical protein
VNPVMDSDDLRDDADDFEDAAQAAFAERYGVHPL